MNKKALIDSWSRMMDKYLEDTDRIKEIQEIAKLGGFSEHEKQMLTEEYEYLVQNVRKACRLIAIAEKVYALVTKDVQA